MSPALPALARVAAGGASAGTELVRWVGAHPTLRKVAPARREDVRQDVSLKLLTDAGPILRRLLRDEPALAAEIAADPLRVEGLAPERLASAERRFRQYVAVMIERRVIDAHRRERALVLDPDGAPPDPLDPAASAEPDPVPPALAALQQAFAQADADELTIRQLEALAFEESTMEALIDAELAARPDAHPDGRRHARDRLYQRHRRARLALESSLAGLASDGAIGADAAEHAGWLIRGLLCRRQTGR